MRPRWSVFALIGVLLAQMSFGAGGACATMTAGAGQQAMLQKGAAAGAARHASAMPCAEHARSVRTLGQGQPQSSHDCCRAHALCHCMLPGIASAAPLPCLVPALFVCGATAHTSLTRLRPDELLRPPIR